MKQLTGERLDKAIQLITSARTELYRVNGEQAVDDNSITMARRKLSLALKQLGE